MAAEERAGDVYAGVIDGLLQYERERKASLEQKALGVITTSGALVTLLFGFASLTGARSWGAIPVASRWLLTAALLALLIGTVLSLRITGPVNYEPLSVKRDLRRMVTDEWFDPPEVGQRLIAEFRVGEIDRWRDANGVKARLLRQALLAESAGVALVAGAVGVMFALG